MLIQGGSDNAFCAVGTASYIEFSPLHTAFHHVKSIMFEPTLTKSPTTSVLDERLLEEVEDDATR